MEDPFVAGFGTWGYQRHHGAALVGPEAAFSGTVPIPTLFHRWYGTMVTWRWTIHPKSSFAAPLLPVFGKLWMGYARQSLETLSDQLVH